MGVRCDFFDVPRRVDGRQLSADLVVLVHPGYELHEFQIVGASCRRDAPPGPV